MTLSARDQTVPSGDQVKAAFPRNVSVFVAFDAFWSLGSPCCVLATIGPAYLLNLGASKTLVQIVMVGMSLLTFSQIWSGQLFGGPRRKISQFFIWAAYCVAWFVYGLAGLLGWRYLPPGAWIVLFALLCASLSAIVCLAGPAYAEMVLENTPLGWRGRLASLRNLGASVCGVAGLFLASWLMTRGEAPGNFHVSFMVGAFFMLLSCASVLFMRDHGSSPASASASLSALEAGRKLLMNFNFRMFLVFYAMMAVGLCFSPLLIGYGKDVLGMTPGDTSQFTIALYVGTFGLGVIVPAFADRFGFRLMGILGALLLVAAYLTPIVLPHSRTALLVSYALLAGSGSLEGLTLANLGTELVPEIKPAMIIAVGSSLIVPVALVVAPLGGRLVDLGGPAGYLAVFLVGVTLAVCALIGFTLLVREPRTGQEIYVRVREM